MSKKKILLTDAEGNTLYPQAVTTNVVDAEGNKVNLDGIWTQDTLKAGKNIEIAVKANPYVIDSHTVALWDFDDSTLTNKIEGTTASITNSDGFNTTFAKFGAAAIKGIRWGGYNYGRMNVTTDPGVGGLSRSKTIDFWFNFVGNSSEGGSIKFSLPLSSSSYSDSGLHVTISNNTPDTITYNCIETSSSGSYVVPTGSLKDNKYHHFAFCYESSTKTCYAFLDGHKFVEIADIPGNLSTLFKDAVYFGGAYMPEQVWYMDELRVSDICRWDDDFEVPTEAYAKSDTSDWYVINNTLDVSGKQDVIADLADIRSGAALGATSVQQADLADVWTKTNLKQGNHIAITQVDKPVIDSDTVTLYHFDNDCIDTISGKDCLDATDSSTVSYLAREKFGKVIYSGLETTYNTNIWLKNDTGLVPAETSFTIDFWINPDNFSKSRGINFINYSSPSAWISIQSNGIYIGQVLYAAGSDHLFLYDTSSMLSTWSHIAFVHDLNTTKNYLFINGVLLESWTYTVSSTYSLFNELKISGMCKVDELRISNVARWTADFTPYTEPYASSDAPAEYTINSTLKAGQNITIDADGYINAAGGGSSAPTRFYFKNFEADESTEEFPNEVDTNMDLTDKFIRVYKNGVYQMQDDESTESGAETVDYYIEGTKVVFHSAFTAETKIIVEVF